MQKKDPFDIQKQKKVLLDVRHEFVDPEEPSTSKEVREMPERFQQIFQKKTPQKVSKLKSFLSSCLVLIQDLDAITELQSLIEETPVDPQLEKKVNQVNKKFKTLHELRMTAQIEDYDMDYIILYLGSDVNILMRQTWESMGKPHLD